MGVSGCKSCEEALFLEHLIFFSGMGSQQKKCMCSVARCTRKDRACVLGVAVGTKGGSLLFFAVFSLWRSF